MTVPVDVNTSVIDLTVSTGSTPYLQIAPSQDTSHLNSAGTNSIVCMFLVYSKDHPVYVDGTHLAEHDWSLYGADYIPLMPYPSSGSYRMAVLVTRADKVVDYNVIYGIHVPSGGWVKGFLVVIDDASPETTYKEFTPLTSTNLNSGSFSQVYPPEPMGFEHRTLGFFMLFKDNNDTGLWVDTSTAGLDGVVFSDTFNVPSNTSLYGQFGIVPLPHVFSETDDEEVNFTYDFSGSGFKDGLLLSVPIRTTPEHEPVTITITAHGPVDVQVD